MAFLSLQCRINQERRLIAIWEEIRDTKYYQSVELVYQWKWDNPDIKQDEIYATDEEKLEAVNKIIASHRAKLNAYLAGPLPRPVTM